LPSVLKKILGSARYLAGLSSHAWDRAMAAHGFTAVLCYHRVVDRPPPDDFFDVERGISAALFEQQIRFMLRYFDPVKPSEIKTHLPAGQRQFAITFDDGCEDNYSVAAPILERLGVSASFFVVKDFIGENQRFWWESLAGILRQTKQTQGQFEDLFPEDIAHTYGLNQPIAISEIKHKAAAQRVLMNAINSCPHCEIEDRLIAIADRLSVSTRNAPRDFPLMSLPQLKDLMRRGFDIGGHTATHCNLGLADAKAVRAEVIDATQRLENTLDAPVRTFAYPYGRRQHIQAQAIDSLTETNVELAFTTEGGVVRPDHDPLALPRFQLNRNQAPVWAYNIDKALATAPFSLPSFQNRAA